MSVGLGAGRTLGLEVEEMLESQGSQKMIRRYVQMGASTQDERNKRNRSLLFSTIGKQEDQGVEKGLLGEGPAPRV